LKRLYSFTENKQVRIDSEDQNFKFLFDTLRTDPRDKTIRKKYIYIYIGIKEINKKGTEKGKNQ
jgi:hypothetical protein